jgi:MFS family permease
VFAGLGALTSLGVLELWQLTLSAFLIGVSFAFEGPARSAYVIELVPEGSTGRALALNTVALNGTRIIGPALSSALLASPLIGVAGAFYVMAALNAVGWLLRIGLPSAATSHHVPSRSSVFSEMTQGIRYVASAPHLRATVLMFLLVVLLGFPHVTLLTGYVEHQLGLPSSSVGWLFGTSALGGLIASVIATSYADSPFALSLFRICGALFGASLLASAWCTNLTWACAIFFVSGIMSGAFMTLYGAALLRTTDARFLGRVMSLGTLGVGAYGLLGLPIGLAADWLGEAAVLSWMGAAVIVVVGVLSWEMGRYAVTPPTIHEEKPMRAGI